MPTLPQIQDKIDAFLTNKWPTIVARQENFRTNNGRYWQGLKTHVVQPEHSGGADDGDTVGDRLDESPDDQGAFSTWLNVFPEWLAELLPCSVTVDVYDSPQGHGWVATVDATYEGVKYARSKNVGPESYRDQGWHIVPDGGAP